MARTAPATQPANTGITSTIWNDQVVDNLTHLLGLKSNGVTLTSLTGGDELEVASYRTDWVYSETRASNGDFATITLSGLTGYSSATGFVCEFGIRSTYATGVAGDTLSVELNGDTTASNYYRQILGSSDAASVLGESGDMVLAFISNANSPASAFSVGEFKCMNMKNTAMWKNLKANITSQLDTSTQRIDNGGLFWKSTSAVTSFFINLTNGTPVTSSYLRVRFLF